jgi:uncharacterized protein YqeY
MTSLLSTIRQDSIAARKNRDAVAASLLVTLLSEAEMTGLNDGKRESTDAEVLATVRKFLKNNDETLKVKVGDEVLLREKALLEGYLPKQLSEDELRAAIQAIASDLGLTAITGKDTGALMKGLNAQYAGQFAGGQASALIKQLASS